MENSWNVDNSWWNIILHLHAKYVTSSNAGKNKAKRFALTDTKCSVPVVAPAPQEYTELLQQLKIIRF